MGDPEEVKQLPEEENEEVLFNAGMKKKKKKEKLIEEPEATHKDANAEKDAADDEDSTALFGMKKKKKKKKEVVEEAEPAEVKEEAVVVDSFSVTDLLTRKKKRKQKMTYAEFVQALGESIEDFETSKKKKKVSQDIDEEDMEDADSEEAAWLDSDRDYTFKELLDRAFWKIEQRNPEHSKEKKKYTMIPPQVMKEGAKKTVFANILDVCKRMRRAPDHVTQFLFAELGTSGSMDGAGRLMMKGRFQAKNIENILRRYILEYVQCKVCKSASTNLMKENRLMFIQCENCNSTRSVTAIKSGFSAQVGKRKR